MIRKLKSVLISLFLLTVFIFLFIHFKDSPSSIQHFSKSDVKALFIPKRIANNDKDVGILEEGDTIMPELGNATLKAELGRSAWRVIHTMAARFPVAPDDDQKSTFKSFIMLFSRLYPCGQCARHFQSLLVEFPPVMDSREKASQWACEIHNQVNLKLKKPKFNCTDVLSHWKCGCDDVKD
ncbi:hypothetical protein DSO57_1020400 [Entomophthora muscae]|uniref:Uncharacterized protein n=1 Tax=Entomophthora muscae TaxID=34485 RepID=A0ACC2RIG8_9FUNG|nr:hypothetical protein DSO57_1020400 [Entomophthora muscae]